MAKIILDYVKERFPEAILDSSSPMGDDTLLVKPHAWRDVATFLRDDPRCAFDMPIDITAVDYSAYPAPSPSPERFEVVFHARSTKFRHRIRMKTAVPEHDPSVPSLVPVWSGVNWFEREVYDMYGIRFDDHPDLRRVLMYPEFVGHPLRKDYPLRGYQPPIPMPTLAGDPVPGVSDAADPDCVDSTVPTPRPPTPAPLPPPAASISRAQENSQAVHHTPELETKELFLQMGPSHPAMHGTVRMDVIADGETVVDIDVHIGYLHRGFEKECEVKTWNQCFPYADRLNYVSPAINNVGYAMVVEKLLGIEVTERCKYIRTIISEIARIQDHLTAIAAAALEMGGFTAMLWGVEARDYYYRLFEELAGARVTLSYCRVGGVAHDLQADFAEKFEEYAKITERLQKDIDTLLTRNRIFIDRCSGTGVMPAQKAIAYGFTGPCLRASGVDYDVRKDHPYLIYDRLDFEVPVGTKGDNYDRYLVRMEEIRQSLRMVRQCLKEIPDGPINVDDWRVFLPPKREVYDTIEGMIANFKLVFEGLKVPRGEAYAYVEGGNGELGFFAVSDGSGRPYKLHVRPPCFALMQGVVDMCRGGMIADIIPTFDAINMIGGEVDR